MTQPGAAPPSPAGDAIPPAAERQAPSRRRRAVLAVLGVAVAIVALAGEPMGLPPLVAVSALAVLAFVLLAFRPAWRRGRAAASGPLDVAPSRHPAPRPPPARTDPTQSLACLAKLPAPGCGGAAAHCWWSQRC